MAAFPAYPNQGRTVREYDLAAAQDFLQGAFVVLNTSGEIAEVGADPAEVTGVALFDAGNLPLTGKMSVAVARSRSTFIMQGTSAPVEADIGVEYGIVEDGDGVYVVDKTETTTTVVKVERIFLETNGFPRDQFEVSVLPSVRTFD